MYPVYTVLAEAGANAGALDSATLDAIKGGFDTLSSTVGQIMPLMVASAVGVIAVTASVNFALKKIKGLLAKAS